MLNSYDEDNFEETDSNELDYIFSGMSDVPDDVVESSRISLMKICPDMDQALAWYEEQKQKYADHTVNATEYDFFQFETGQVEASIDLYKYTTAETKED